MEIYTLIAIGVANLVVIGVISFHLKNVVECIEILTEWNQQLSKDVIFLLAQKEIGPDGLSMSEDTLSSTDSEETR